MCHRNRSGFTWRELVVVLLVLGVTLAVLLPALNQQHGGRQATCRNRQKQLALALLQYEATHRQFPGYVNRIGRQSDGRHLVGSWGVALFPYLGENDLWKKWREGNQSSVYRGLFICPSDPSQQTSARSAPLSYVANCGRPGDLDTLADGMFFNHDVDSEPLRTSFDYLATHDGAQHTLLLSENVQAGRWTDTAEADVGMVWRQSPGPCSNINRCENAGDRPGDIKYARPSSNHGGGVVVSFCDGHVEFLREDIDYRVYQHLMTPDSVGAGVPGKLEEHAY